MKMTLNELRRIIISEMAAKSASDLPTWVSFAERPTSKWSRAFFIFDSRKLDPDDALIAGITIERFGSGWNVGSVWAKSGYGPMMYRIAMEAAAPGGLGPNRGGNVSDEAQAVWDRFRQDEQPIRWDKEEAREYFLPRPGSGELFDLRSKMMAGVSDDDDFVQALYDATVERA